MSSLIQICLFPSMICFCVCDTLGVMGERVALAAKESLSVSSYQLKLASLRVFHRHHHHQSIDQHNLTRHPSPISQSLKADKHPTRMRPPTRSTRSVRPSLNTNNARRSRSSATGPSSSHPVASEAAGNNNPNPPKPQSIMVPTAADAKVDPGTSPGSDPALANADAPVVGCFPVLPPPTFIYENQGQSQSPSEPLFPLVSPSLSVAGSIFLGGKPPRPRHRMSSNKLETLDAFFRRNTHPSRKEKEAICRDLDM
jgi:hypothetical protein